MKHKSIATAVLYYIGWLLPGDWLKTFVYLNFVMKPRRLLRAALQKFYRMDHVYEVLYEARRKYASNLSILEFGTNEGYAFRKLLYAVRYTNMEDRVICHGFDTFDGMPEPADRADLNIIADRPSWSKGQFRGGYDAVKTSCERKYHAFKLHKGLFEETLTAEFLESLRTNLPLLVWIDCDFYSSSRTVMERIIPFLPNGCVVYFDEYEVNYGSRFAGEARVVYELNNGIYGNGIELVLDKQLSLDSARCYRFVREDGGPFYEFAGKPYVDLGRSPTNDSPLP